MLFIEKTQADDGSRDMFNLLIGSNLSIMGPIGGAPEFKMIVYDSDSQLSRGYTKYGSVITRDRNNPGKLIQITYPEKEAVAKVIVTSNKDFMEQSGEAIGCPVEEVPTSEGPIGGGGSSSSEPIPVSG
jgi:hypothetical protein